MDKQRNENAGSPEVIVVTGASAGVGRAIVREFAKARASIGLIARDKRRLDETVREIRAAGGRALGIECDVADAAQVESAATAVEEEFGPIDVWVNNAMTTVFSPFDEITPEEFRRATEVTYLGNVYGTMAAMRRMKARDRGCVVQVGSALAYRSVPLQAPYCGAKHAIVGFTDSIRSELIHDKSNVRITMVHLPAMNTPQFDWCRNRLPRHPMPVPPIYQPEVAARAVVWAAHHTRREIYVGFSTAKAIYAQKLVPGFADWYLAKTDYDAQQTSASVDKDRPDNLFQPVPGEFSAHGDFDTQASTVSIETWSSVHRLLLSAAGLIAGGIALAARRGARA